MPIKLEKPDRKKVESLLSEFHYPELIAEILAARGLDTREKVLEYIKPGLLQLTTPYAFADMDKAATRALDAARAGKGILIFGDRDVDGVTATAILYHCLERFGAQVVYRVPEGNDHYGISKEAIADAAMNDIELIITVDCGISAVEEIEYANGRGMDVIVTDHHEPQGKLPKAYAILNPKVPECGYPFPNLCGASVALKLAMAIFEKDSLTDYHNEEQVFFDIETTGLDPTRDQIIEIGAVRIKNGVRLAEFDMLAKASGPLSPEIVRLTHITDEMLERDGKDLSDVLEAFAAFAGNSRMIGHNAVEFDMRFIQAAMKKHLGKTLANPVEDTLKLSRVMLKRISDHKLATVAEHLGIYPDKSKLHRSVADSDLCAEVYRRLVLQRSNRLMEAVQELLPLAAIGTIADIMPLQGENRIIVKAGLKYLTQAPSGLIALLRAVQFNLERVSNRDISWQISPLLNSPGRIGNASISVELLISRKLKESEDLVKEILSSDTARKTMVDDGEKTLAGLLDPARALEKKCIFLSSKDFTRGTTGLLANRLSMQYQVPTVIIALEGGTAEQPQIATGSVRTPNGFDVVKMLEAHSGLLIQFGGHKAAGGFTMKPENLAEFQAGLEKYMEHFKAEDFQEELHVDAELSRVEDFNINLVRYIDNLLEPFGNGNDSVRLLIRGMKIASVREIGKTSSHVLLTLRKDGRDIPAVGWNWAKKLRELGGGDLQNKLFDIVATPEINRYQGQEEARLSVLEIELQEPRA